MTILKRLSLLAIVVAVIATLGSVPARAAQPCQPVKFPISGGFFDGCNGHFFTLTADFHFFCSEHSLFSDFKAIDTVTGETCVSQNLSMERTAGLRNFSEPREFTSVFTDSSIIRFHCPGSDDSAEFVVRFFEHLVVKRDADGNFIDVLNDVAFSSAQCSQ